MFVYLLLLCMVCHALHLVEQHVDNTPFSLHFQEHDESLVKFSYALLSAHTLHHPPAISSHLSMNFFPSESYSSTVRRCDSPIPGTTTVRGFIDNLPLSSFTMSYCNGSVLLTCSIPELDQSFTVKSVPDSSYYLITKHQSSLQKRSCETLLPPDSNKDTDFVSSFSFEPHFSQNSERTIDLLIVYTPAARIWANNNGGLNNILAISVSNTMDALEDSGVSGSVNLVHHQEVAYSESGNMITDLVRVTFHRAYDPFGWEAQSGGYFMEEVHDIRSKYSADLVALWTHDTTSSSAGVAWLLTSTQGFPFFSFSVTSVQYATRTDVFTHELGHNLGLGHSIEQNFQPGPGIFSYSAGWRWKTSDSHWYNSIMSYSHGSYFDNGKTSTGVPVFSNPRLTYEGVPVGDEEEGDAVRSLGRTIPIVARYRNEIQSSINFDCQISNCVLSSSTVGHWFGTSVARVTGVFSARSGFITADDRFCYLNLFVDVPSVVKFDWKLESDHNENFGGLFLNDDVIAAITGWVGWRKMELQVPDAESVVYIAYFKFSNVIVGCDCLYVDNLQVFPAIYLFLSVNDTSHGSIETNSPQLVAINSDSDEIHVNPVFGYELSYWLINGTDILTSDPLVIRNVQGNTTAEAFFQLKTYSVDIESSVGGFTNPEGSQQVEHGDSLIVTAIPYHGYVFIQWNDQNTDNPRTIHDVQADLVITVEFTLIVYTVDIESSVGGFTNPEGSQQVEHGDSLIVTAIPDPGYVFIQWNDQNTDNPRTIHDVQADLVITAEFTLIVYTVDIESSVGGFTDPEGSQQVEHGDFLIVTAIPDPGYVFIQWNDQNTDNPRTIHDVQAVLVITAEFTLIVYTVDIESSVGGFTNPEGSQQVEHGDSLIVTAIPDPGYVFIQWNDQITDNPRTIHDVQADLVITAEFTLIVYTVDIESSVGGFTNLEGSQQVEHGDSLIVTAIPDPGYVFIQWNDQSTDNPRTIHDVQADLVITAEFTLIVYTVDIESSVGGFTDPEGSQQVEHGDSLIVTAIPDPGYVFIQWNDQSTDNPRTIHDVQADLVITAEFTLIVYTVDIESSVGGFTDPEGSQQVEHGDSLIVTAIPDPGYVFIQWNDQSTDNPRTIHDVQADLVITAEFEDASSSNLLTLIIFMSLVLLILFILLGFLQFGIQKLLEKEPTLPRNEKLCEMMTFPEDDDTPIDLEVDLPPTIMVEVEPSKHISGSDLSQQSDDDHSDDVDQVLSSQSEIDCKSDSKSEHSSCEQHVDDHFETL
ncbi:hypothetical protein GEMRC1_003439 [Eukaryota sp. GEM-RC1]